MFVLSGLWPIETAHCASTGRDIGLSSEEISSIHDFREQIKESIGKVKTLIKNKELDKAKRELENVLDLVREKISLYEDKAKTLVSEEKGNSAKVYSQEVYFLGEIAVQISKSLKEIERYEVDSKIEQSKEYLAKGNFGEAQTLLEEALKILPEQEHSKKREIESLLASIPELKQKHQTRGDYERVERIVVEAREQVEGQKLDELIKQGRDHLNNNNFEEAKRKFLEASQIKPKNELVLEYLAETEQAKKEYEKKKVLEEIEGVITEGKKYLEAEQLDQNEIQSLLADVDKTRQTIYNTKFQKQTDEYIANSVENLEKNQFEKINVIIDNGMKYLEEGQFDKAESAFEEAVEKAPLDIKEQIVKIIEERVNSLGSESQQRTDKYISDEITQEESEKLEKTKSSPLSNQLVEQIRSKIAESQEILEKGRIEE